MKMKYIFGVALASLVFASCSEDQMDSINKDQRHPSVNVVDAKFQITDAEVSTVYSTLCGSYAWYVSSYTEQLFGTGNNQLKNIELRQMGETASSSTFNNEWNNTYLNLNNLIAISKKCAEGGVNANQYDILGIEQVLEALNWGVLTDLHGDIPYKECFTGVNAKIDSQKDVYDHIFNLLDEAQKNLDKGGSHAADQDLLFKGKLNLWKGLAHALKARYLLHTYGVNKTNALLQQVVDEANAAIATGFTECKLSIFNGQTSDNSWSAYWWSRHYIGSTTTMDKLLAERNDPRESIYNVDMFGANILGEPGNDAQAQLDRQLNAPAWLENGAAYLHLFSKSELYFILAEGKARLGQDAKSDFEEGVKASIADYLATGGPALGDEFAITNEQVSSYLTSIAARFSANPLKEILIQKYIAQARDEQLETYNDIRRCRFVDGSHPVELTNSKNVSAGANRWPLRLPYGDSDVVSNPNVAAAFGSGNDAGMYIFTNPVWWAGGK